MYQVEIEYPDGSKSVYNSFTLEQLMRLLDKCEIVSFKISLRQSLIAPNPFTKQP